MNSEPTTRTRSAGTNEAKDHAAASEWDVGITKFGKPITIKRQRVGFGFEVKVGGGGLTHPSLTGSFTSLLFAKQAVRAYMESVHYDLPEDPDFTSEG